MITCFDQLSQLCSEGLAQLYECSCNGMLHLFPMETSSTAECLSADNPFLSKNSVLRPFLSVGAIVQTSQAAKLSEKNFGRLEEQTRKVSIARVSIEIPTGIYGYIEAPAGDLLGGKVVEVVRDQIPVIILSLDTSKPVPFRPELVELPGWPRTIQN